MSKDTPYDGNGASVLREFRDAVAGDLNDLAILHDAEPSQAFLHALEQANFPKHLGLRLQSGQGRDAALRLRKVLDSLRGAFDDDIVELLAVDYADIYLSYRLRASPYESVWLDEESLERQQPMFEVRECYRRHGLLVSDWSRRADDHLVLQLQFLAFLLDPACPREGALEEAAAFMDRHLMRWLDRFAERVADRCATEYFASIALLTSAYCTELRQWLVELGLPRLDVEALPPGAGTPERGPIEVPFVPGVGPVV